MTRRPTLPPGGFTPSFGSDFGPAIRALCNSMAAAFCIIAAHVRFGSWPFQNVLPLEVGTRRSGGVS